MPACKRRRPWRFGSWTATRAVPKLVQMLEKGKGEAPYQAAVALGQLGSDVGRIANPSGNPGDHPDGLPSRPKELFQDRSVATGKNAHPTAAVDWAFLPDGGSGGSETGSKGKPTALLPPILGALVGALHHADEDVRRAAARSLGEIGPPALPAIQKVLGGKDARTSREAAESLGYLGSAAIPALTVALRHADPQVRRIAARALGRLGHEAKKAQSALVEAVSDPDASVRDTAAEALKRVGEGEQ